MKHIPWANDVFDWKFEEIKPEFSHRFDEDNGILLMPIMERYKGQRKDIKHYLTDGNVSKLMIFTFKFLEESIPFFLLTF
jgi:hypothetical protein